MIHVSSLVYTYREDSKFENVRENAGDLKTVQIVPFKLERRSLFFCISLFV